MNSMILMTYMISNASVTFLCCSSRSLGRSSNAIISTFDSVFLVIFPFNEPKIGLSIYSAFSMSDFVDGAVGKHIAFYIFNKVFSVWLSYNVLYGLGFTGIRVIFNSVFILMLSTVLTRSMSLSTSEKNIPFSEV